MTKKEESDFGKGLVICLTKFSEHFENDMCHRIGVLDMLLKKPKEQQEIILSGNPPDNLNYGKYVTDSFIWFMTKTVPIFGSVEKSLSDDINTWMNGASDHLYEIEAPKGKKWKKVSLMVSELKHKGLDMGHGSGLMGEKLIKYEDLYYLKELTRKIALEIDKNLGLKPEEGKW